MSFPFGGWEGTTLPFDICQGKRHPKRVHQSKKMDRITVEEYVKIKFHFKIGDPAVPTFMALRAFHLTPLYFFL